MERINIVDSNCEDKGKDTFVIPPLTPINPPNVVGLFAGKMTSLLDVDSEEERAKKPMTDEEMSLMPKLVAENVRFACCEKDCDSITIDEIMLLYHIQALHPRLVDFDCPHCPDNVVVPFDDLEFHMRCHGDLLFRCGHCDYYHWQKRTAEKHVADEHPNRKQYTRNVRAEFQLKETLKSQPPPVTFDDATAKNMKKPSPIIYLPYKCGLCEVAEETLQGIQEHCVSVHGISKQFKCSLCDSSSDTKTEIEKHFASKHASAAFCMIRIFFVDPSSSSSGTDAGNVISAEEKRDPLWRRNMPGLRHIRGILFEEELTPLVSQGRRRIDASDEVSKEEPGSREPKNGRTVDQSDNFPMKCKECGLVKKTIKALKMHIKLLHLRTGKFLCLKCHFSANILGSVHTHYKITHPEEKESKFEERSDEAKAFSHDFWKAEWGIPTLVERKAIVERRGIELKKEESIGSSAKKRLKLDKKENTEEEQMTSVNSKGKKGKRKYKRKVSKRKLDGQSTSKAAPFEWQEERQSDIDEHSMILGAEDSDTSTTAIEPMMDKKAMERIMEISPFEATPTFKCQFCPKRSQVQERLERHLVTDHSDKTTTEVGIKTLTRDQVVDMLTLSSSSADYMCFYCDDTVGSIRSLKEHFDSCHPADTFKVKSFQGRGVPGYLECQICGHLTPGFERSKQKVHFHEEHPLETTVNASKYVSKAKGAQQQQQKVDLTAFNGTTMRCPKEDCNFEAKTFFAVNNHLRRHTQTFKCGHCGKTHTNSSEFHRHTSLLHGDKIPDLIKDPEAEAEFEALKGLFEADLTDQLLSSRICSRAGGRKNKRAKLSNTARKSTSSRSSRSSNTARKSTGIRTSSLREFSFYGVETDPVDLSQIKTRMSIPGMGGIEITLNAEKMADIINMKPKVIVKDCQKSLERT